MKQHLNTLFVTTQNAFLAKDGEAVAVKVEHETVLRIPLINLGGIVCFGAITVSPWLVDAATRAGIAISLLSEQGRFLAKIQGFTPGNVLLRREQYRWADDPVRGLAVARNVVAAKLANCRAVLMRGLRDHELGAERPHVETAAGRLALSVDQAQQCPDVNVLRGIEGEAATYYFGAFNSLITVQRESFLMAGRSRRPPLDRTNALLSFLYAMLGHDARGACEAAGLDAAVGFLHTDRPGRPGLALDLMEEFRPVIVDRLVLSLINRHQVRPEGFVIEEGGGVRMDDATRKTVIAAYQRRKQGVIEHPFLDEKTTVGLLPHLQARLLARHVRGDLDAYPPFVWR